MKQAIRIYPSIARQTHSTIAVAIEDALHVGHVASNEAAACVMRRLFDVDTTKHLDYPVELLPLAVCVPCRSLWRACFRYKWPFCAKCNAPAIQNRRGGS